MKLFDQDREGGLEFDQTMSTHRSDGGGDLTVPSDGDSGYIHSYFVVEDDEGKRFFCNACGVPFKQKVKVERHLLAVHGQDRPFLCSKCGFSFKMQQHLRQHLRTVHDGERPFSCVECDQTFKRRGDLLRHSKIHTEGKQFSCDECGVSFKREDAKRKHLSVVHNENRPFSCSVCDRAFKRKTDLRDHASVHSQERPFTCHHCGLTFNRKHNVKRHLLYVHFFSGKRPFKCRKCDQRFKQKRSLQRHSLLHDANAKKKADPEEKIDLGPKVGPTFNCDNCDKTFKFRFALSRHARQCGKRSEHAIPEGRRDSVVEEEHQEEHSLPIIVSSRSSTANARAEGVSSHRLILVATPESADDQLASIEIPSPALLAHSP